MLYLCSSCDSNVHVKVFFSVIFLNEVYFNGRMRIFYMLNTRSYFPHANAFSTILHRRLIKSTSYLTLPDDRTKLKFLYESIKREKICGRCYKLRGNLFWMNTIKGEVAEIARYDRWYTHVLPMNVRHDVVTEWRIRRYRRRNTFWKQVRRR